MPVPPSASAASSRLDLELDPATGRLTGPSLQRYRRLSARFSEVGFEAPLISERMRLANINSVVSRSCLAMEYGSEAPLDVLFRLFVLRFGQPAELVEAALGPQLLNELQADQVLYASAPGRLRAAFQILSSRELLLCKDDILLEDPSAGLRPDLVLGAGTASATVAMLAIHTPGGTVLDMGCGGGIQSFLAVQAGAGRTVGVDISPRALQFAAVNTVLNGMEAGCTWRQGSFFEPLEPDQRFDLIVCNPPFFISPSRALLYRDSGLEADGLGQLLLREIPQHLQPGGYGVVLMNWYHQTEKDWTERPAAWLQQSGCDALLVSLRCDAPMAYVHGWLNEEVFDQSQKLDQLLRDWMAYYRQLNAGAFTLGAIVLRRRPDGSEGSIRTLVCEGPFPSTPCGRQLLRIFANHDCMEQHDSVHGILSLRPAIPADCELAVIQRPAPDSGRLEVAGAMLRQGGGLRQEARLDPNIYRLLSTADGQTSLADLTGQLAGLLGRDPQALERGVAELAVRLAAGGLLELRASE